ncbi:aspyridones efflux protein [Trichophyton mentagrophytes]|nr:aspyridones efflux protein [Trichophyton mentagrophytes]
MKLEEESKVLKNSQPQVHESTVSFEDREGSLEAVSGTPPNGGRNAWMQVMGACVLTQNTWGLVMAHGAFQASYSQTILPTTSQSALSWIGSIQAFFIFFVGIFSSKAVGSSHFHHVTVAGLIVQLLGLVMTSISTKYYQFFLSEGVCVGIGSGLLFAPGITIAASYFSTKRPLAIAVATSGAAIGGIVFPIVSYWLIVAVGFPWAVRIITSLVLLASGSTLYTLQPYHPSIPQKGGPFITFGGFKDASYCTYVVAAILGLIGGFVPFFYIPVYGLALGLRTELTSYFVSALNMAALIGGFSLTVLASRLGNLNTAVLFSNVCGIVLISLVLAVDPVGVIIGSLFYALVAGYQLVLLFTAMASINVDTSPRCSQGRAALIFGSFGALLGTPIAGGILSKQDSNAHSMNPRDWNFTLTLLFSGGLIFLGGVFLAVTRVLKSGLRWEKI